LTNKGQVFEPIIFSQVGFAPKMETPISQSIQIENPSPTLKRFNLVNQIFFLIGKYRKVHVEKIALEQ
jgi:hypothetical protein